MPKFVPDFVKSTLSLLLFTMLGVAGKMADVNVTPNGIMAKTDSIPSFALGGVGYYTGNRGGTVYQHELGHLEHEKELGSLYLPMAGLSSLYGNVMHLLGKLDREGYYGMWTEREADRRGGVER